MIQDLYQRKFHIDELPFSVLGGIDDSVVYIRMGYDQYWRNPNGGWDVTSYWEIIKTIEKLGTKL